MRYALGRSIVAHADFAYLCALRFMTGEGAYTYASSYLYTPQQYFRHRRRRPAFSCCTARVPRRLCRYSPTPATPEPTATPGFVARHPGLCVSGMPYTTRATARYGMAVLPLVGQRGLCLWGTAPYRL